MTIYLCCPVLSVRRPVHLGDRRVDGSLPAGAIAVFITDLAVAGSSGCRRIGKSSMICPLKALLGGPKLVGG
jgi:hypothetical protein